MKPLNAKAKMLEKAYAADEDVVGMQQVPAGCTSVFDPGWEVTPWGGVNGMCAPMEADLLACSSACWWPAQVPDTMTNAPSWVKACTGPIAEDWRTLQPIYPGEK